MNNPKNPKEKKKNSKSNSIFIFFILIILTLWIGIGAYLIFPNTISFISSKISQNINSLPTLHAEQNGTLGTAQIYDRIGWEVTKKSGEEGLLTFWKSGTDKKVELGWIPPDNDCSGWVDKYLSYENGTRIKDDKDKDILLKCESSKCDGQNCYHISLTNAQAINIDDYIKLGENSIETQYFNESTILYTFDTGNATLKLTNMDIPENMNNITIDNIDNETFKFGAFDNTATNETELHNYTYYLESTRPITRFRNGVYVYENDIGVEGEKHLFDFEDVCLRQFNPHLVFYNATYLNESIENCLNDTYAEEHIEECYYQVEENRTEYIKADCQFEINEFNATVSFISNWDIDPSTTWFNSSWTYQKQINISNTNVDSNLSGFPVLIHFKGDADINASALASGNDIRFALNNGTEIPYEKEFFNGTDGNFWVKADVDSAVNTPIYIYYGNETASAGEDGEDSGNVWNSNYKSVYHMESLDLDDSTSNGNNFRSVEASIVNSKVGNATQYLSSNYAHSSNEVGWGLFTPKNLTIEMWIYPLTSRENGLVDFTYDIDGSDNGIALWMNTDEQLTFGAGGILDNAVVTSNTGVVTIGQWNHVLVTRRGTNVSFYVNGINVGSGVVGSGDIVYDYDGTNRHIRYIGYRYETRTSFGQNGHAWFSGNMDEVAVWKRALTEAEITSRYNGGTGTELDGDESGLLALWKFDEASYDGSVGEVIETKNGIDGISNGAVINTTAKFGNSTFFDGSNDNIQQLGVYDDDPNTDFTNNNFTLITLIKPHDTVGGVIYDNRQEIGGTDSGWFWTLEDDVGGTRDIQADINGDDDNGASKSSGNAYTENIWNLIVVTKNSSNDFSFYNHGSYVSGITAGSSDTVVYTATFDLHSIGRITDVYDNSFDIPDRFINATIDELRIYDGVLSDDYLKFMFYNINSSNNELTWGDEETEAVADASPTTTLSLPANNTNYTAGTNVTYECNATDDSQLVNATLYIWNSDNSVNYSNMVSLTGTDNSTTWSANLSSDGNYLWNCLAVDNASQEDWGDANWTVNISTPAVDTTPPYFVDINNETFFENDTLIAYYNASDETALSCWTVNNSDFSVNCSGYVTNTTNVLGIYWLNFTINDTSNNLNTTEIFWNITPVPDKEPPSFTEWYNVSIESNQSVNEYYNFTDNNQTDCWTVNDTSNFAINCSGHFYNITGLSNQMYWVNLTINDSSNNLNTTEIFVNVTEKLDKESPYFVDWNNVSQLDNITLAQYFNASDNIALSCWSVNNTDFSINCSGYLTNVSALAIGTHWINLTINDTSNNLNTTEIWIEINDSAPVDLTSPYFVDWYNVSIESNQSVNEYFNASDDVSLSCWSVNDTSNFAINCSGYFSNITGLSNQVYWVNLTINDSSNNLNTTEIFVNVTEKLDKSPPYFIDTPDITREINDTVYLVDYNASDDIALDCFTVNNSNFAINCSGYLSNSSALSVGIYYLNITINDSSNNLNTTQTYVNITDVLDKVPPYFVDINNVSQLDNVTLAQYWNASDNIALSCWSVNDTDFSINCSGYLTNTTSLSLGKHWINLTINDTSNNLNTTEVFIEMNDSTPVGDTTPPYFVDIANMTFYENDTLVAYYNASDDVSLSCWSVNNSDFSVNCSGFVTNTSAILGIYWLNFTINDTSNNLNTTEVFWDISSVPDKEMPSFTDIANLSYYDNQSVGYDVNATDNVAVSCFTINDTSNFAINCSGFITNVTGLSIQQYFVNITVNDTSNNLNTTEIWINISNSTQPDLQAPYFNEIPQNLSIYDNQSVYMDINATDPEGNFDSYSINWTTIFSINESTGIISNISSVTVGEYYINISINDTYGNTNTTYFFVNVSNSTIPDIIPPTFDNLRNFTQVANNSFSNSITASDNVAVDTYSLNDTSYFNISSAGLIQNVTNLSRIEIHWLNISVNDTSGNIVTGIFFINITEQSASQCGTNITVLRVASSNKRPYGRLCYWLDFR